MQSQVRTDGSRQYPRREVADFIRDFGSARQRGDATWICLYPGKLPDYLRRLPVLEEAMRWTLVISAGGATTVWLRLNAPGRLNCKRGQA